MQERILGFLFLSSQTNRKVLNAGVGVAILIALVTAIVSLVHLRQQAELRAEVGTQNLARSIEQTLEGMIDTVDMSLLASSDEISRQMAAGMVDLLETHRFVEQQLKRLPHMAYLRGANEHGDVIYGPGILTPPNNIADREYFKRLRDDPKGDSLINQHLLGRIAGKWAWLFVRRINKPDGSFGGVIFAGILAEHIEALFFGIQLGADGSIGLRDADMGLIARFPPASDTTVPRGDKRLSKPFIESLKINRSEGTYISGATSIDGISRTHSYRRNVKYDFTINVGISSEAALASWYQQIGIIAAMLIAFIAAALAFAWVINRAWQRQDRDMASIAESQQSLREAQRISHIGNWSLDINNNVLVWSDEIYRIFEIDPTLFGASYEAFLGAVHPEDRAAVHDAYTRSLTTRQPYEITHRLQMPDGRIKYVREHCETSFDLSGKPTHSLGTVQDVTDSVLQEQALRESEERFRTVANYNYDWEYWRGPNKEFLYLSPSCERITGYAQYDFISNPDLVERIIHPEDRALWERHLLNYREDGEQSLEFRIVTKSGEIRWIAHGCRPIFGSKGEFKGRRVSNHDITPIKAYQQQLEHVAHYDSLTNLPNRVLLADRLRQAIAQSQRRGNALAVVYLDLDGFKEVNDQHGHAMGDKLLITLAQRMKETLREGDTLARLGGDEFIVVLVDLMQPQDCEHILERLLQAAADSVTVENVVLQVSASIGVTFYPRDGADADLLIRHADQAMYQSKQAGRNRYSFFNFKLEQKN